MYDPVFPQRATEVLTRLFAMYRRSPREAAARLNQESAGLSPDLLSNLRQFGSTPTPRQLQALKLRFSLTIGGAFKLFGYRLDSMRGVEALLNGGRTRFEGGHQRGRAREVHRSLGMGHASNRKSEQVGSHRADGRQAGCTEGSYRPLDGGRCRLPIASGVESESTAESIHFAPSLTGCQLWRKVRMTSILRLMIFRKRVMRLWNNEGRKSVGFVRNLQVQMISGAPALNIDPLHVFRRMWNTGLV